MVDLFPRFEFCVLIGESRHPVPIDSVGLERIENCCRFLSTLFLFSSFFSSFSIPLSIVFSWIRCDWR
jgi:hypothetical protein